MLSRIASILFFFICFNAHSQKIFIEREIAYIKSMEDEEKRKTKIKELLNQIRSRLQKEKVSPEIIVNSIHALKSIDVFTEKKFSAIYTDYVLKINDRNCTLKESSLFCDWNSFTFVFVGKAKSKNTTKQLPLEKFKVIKNGKELINKSPAGIFKGEDVSRYFGSAIHIKMLLDKDDNKIPIGFILREIEEKQVTKIEEIGKPPEKKRFKRQRLVFYKIEKSKTCEMGEVYPIKGKVSYENMILVLHYFFDHYNCGDNKILLKTMH